MLGKYELVLQFPLPPRDVAQFDRVTQLEAELSKPSSLFALDGDDCRLGSMELYLMTDDPAGCLDLIWPIIPAHCSCRAGYRHAHAREEALVPLRA